MFNLYFIFLYGFAVTLPYSDASKKQTNQVGPMIVSWSLCDETFSFSIESPGSGWLALGLNEVQGLKGTYLVMANQVNGESNVVEHYVFAPGNYRPFHEFQIPPHLIRHDLEVYKDHRKFTCSIPSQIRNQYTKSLERKKEIFLTVAYSNHEDFQHHSVFRKTILIPL